MWRVIRTPLVGFHSRVSEYNTQSFGVTGGYVTVITMFCRFTKESHSTARNTEACSKWQMQWKLRIWEASEQRCARHHAVCWWSWGQGMQSELTVACLSYNVFCLLLTVLTKLHLKLQIKQRILHNEDSNIIVAFWFYATLWDLNVPTFCRNILLPSSGCLNLVQVGAEVTEGRKWCLSRKVGGNFGQPESWNVEDRTGIVTTQQ
jgi:hypothetical protein